MAGLQADDDTDADVSDAPIVQLVRSLIEQAVRQRASDIHIEALEMQGARPLPYRRCTF